MQHSISSSCLVRLREVAQYSLRVGTVLNRSLKEEDVQVEETEISLVQPPLMRSRETINRIVCCRNGLECVPADHISLVMGEDKNSHVEGSSNESLFTCTA